MMSLIFDKRENVTYIVHIANERMLGLNEVKKYRKQQGYTQMELARKLGVARQTINLIENNKYNPSLSLCISLAKNLGTDLNALFWEGKEDEK